MTLAGIKHCLQLGGGEWQLVPTSQFSRKIICETEICLLPHPQIVEKGHSSTMEHSTNSNTARYAWVKAKEELFVS